MNDYLRCYAPVDLDAIEHNIDEIRNKVGQGVRIQAVIKADGYGHGAIPIAKRLAGKVQYFAVASIDEAIELREGGITHSILILGYTSPKQYDEIIKYDIAQTIYSYDMAEAMDEAAKRNGRVGKIHIAVDTGMTRIGFEINKKSLDDVEKIAKLSHVEIEGMFSHFSCADMHDKEYSYKQMERYDWFDSELVARGINIPVKHLCNSAGIIEFDSHRFNMVRAGIMMYGLYPSDEVCVEAVDLHPALSWKCHVVNVREVEAGCGVSYGATYVTSRRTKIATLSVGYADGYPRALSNLGRVIIHGQYAPIIGRVCMDQMMVDVSHIENVTIEDEVTLVGREGDAVISVEELADMAGSFNYEFICNISSRVKRIYND